MQFSNHRSRAARGSIVYLAVDAIAPSAVQPRQNFSRRSSRSSRAASPSTACSAR